MLPTVPSVRSHGVAGVTGRSYEYCSNPGHMSAAMIAHQTAAANEAGHDGYEALGSYPLDPPFPTNLGSLQGSTGSAQRGDPYSDATPCPAMVDSMAVVESGVNCTQPWMPLEINDHRDMVWSEGTFGVSSYYSTLHSRDFSPFHSAIHCPCWSSCSSNPNSPFGSTPASLSCPGAVSTPSAASSASHLDPVAAYTQPDKQKHRKSRHRVDKNTIARPREVFSRQSATPEAFKKDGGMEGKPWQPPGCRPLLPFAAPPFTASTPVGPQAGQGGIVYSAPEFQGVPSDKHRRLARNRVAATKSRAKTQAAEQQLEVAEQNTRQLHVALAAEKNLHQEQVDVLRNELLLHSNCCPLIQRYLALTAEQISNPAVTAATGRNHTSQGMSAAAIVVANLSKGL